MSTMDKENFAERIRECTPGMYRLALGILHNHAQAEDAVSEAVLKAYENLDSLRNPARFRAWIMEITANEAKKTFNQNKRSVPLEDFALIPSAFKDDHHELWDVVMKLENGYREVIILYFYEGFAQKEIADILKIPEGTVKSRLHRGKKQLRDML